jgi:hypothetical protein
MVFYSGLRFGREQIVAGRFEEFADRLLFKGRRVCQVEHNLGTRQRFRQAFTCDGVDAGIWRGG